MDSSTQLDFALFQLTPTRTRCDLILFRRGGKSEKLASGLFEPFIAHLGFAKDQISKGGYSIKLSPPPTTHPATWFTKATFGSFVRFVSTPDILERFVSLEREILQIDTSVQASECTNSNVAMPPEEGRQPTANGTKTKSTLSDVPEDNSKVQLQRLMEARKAMLLKEQAMAYARGFVAGFGIDEIDDLISFADAFKASRLRDSCMKFKELCQKKHADRLWMAELAAVEASELSLMGTSGIVLTNPINTPDRNMMLNVFKSAQNGSADAIKSDTIASLASSDSQKDGSLPASNHIPSANSKVQVPMPWKNLVPPHYMYNFQMPPYQGYMYPPVQAFPPDYPRHMQRPTNQKSYSGKNVKPVNKKEESEEDEQTDSNDSDTGGSDSDSYTIKERKSSHVKKYKKKQSKIVVIRNINYITPRNGEAKGIDGNSSTEDEFNDEESFNKPRKLEKSHNAENGTNDCDNGFANVFGEKKKNESWDDFKNLLMRDGDAPVNGLKSLHSFDNQFLGKSCDPDISGDSLVTNQQNCGHEDRVKLVEFENGEIISLGFKRKECVDINSSILTRLQDSETDFRGVSSPGESESFIIRNRTGDDCHITSHGGTAFNGDATTEKELFNSEMTRKSTFVDDSIMVQARSSVDVLNESSQWKTDINMIMDRNQTSEKENCTGDALPDQHNAREPQDLYMVLERTSEVDSENISWSMEDGIDISLTKVDNRSSNIETNGNTDKKLPSNSKSTVTKSCELPKKSKESRPKVLRGSLRKSDNSGTMSTSKKPPLLSRPVIHKRKFEKEEEIRQKIEELAIERQKRIAERTAAMGSGQVTSKKTPIRK